MVITDDGVHRSLARGRYTSQNPLGSFRVDVVARMSVDLRIEGGVAIHAIIS